MGCRINLIRCCIYKKPCSLQSHPRNSKRMEIYKERSAFGISEGGGTSSTEWIAVTSSLLYGE